MPEMPMIGMDLGEYRLQAVLGRGGMSIVYRAENLRLGSTVAVKVLAPELALNDVFRERFLHESRIAASLNHPNVIPIFDAGPYEDLLFIAMRYVAGADLRSVLKEQASVTPAQALLLIEQTGRALDAAHKRGLVHRDVKPANILIERGTDGDPDHVYLADFGITKHALSQSGLTATGQFVGTIDYVAPEQILGKPIDGRCDIYSLGCVLYETLTGSVPFRKEHDAAVIWAQVEEAPPPPTTHVPTLPREIDDVIAKAMAKSPEDRYPTCREFVAAVRNALERSAHPTRMQPESLVDERRAPPELPIRSDATAGAAQTYRAESEERRSTTEPQVRAAPPVAPDAPIDPGAAAAPPLASAQPPGPPPTPTAALPALEGQPDHSRRRLVVGVALLVAALAGVGAWLALRGGTHPAAARQSHQSPNRIINALSSANRSGESRGAIAPRHCKAMSPTRVACTAPTHSITTVSFQTYPSLHALYARYIAEVKHLSSPDAKKLFNVKDCQLKNPYGEVGWLHDFAHPMMFSVKQSASGKLSERQLDGRVFCTITNDGIAEIAWTTNGGKLFAIASGPNHEDVLSWWAKVHHNISVGHGMMSMGSTHTTSTDMTGMTGTTMGG